MGGLFRSFQADGVAPRTGTSLAEATFDQLNKAIVQAGKDSTLQKVTSWSEFAEFYRKRKLLSPTTLANTPERYMFCLWLFQGVSYIHCSSSWTKAQAYLRHVVDQWDEGFLNITAILDNPDFLRGDVEGSLNTKAVMAQTLGFVKPTAGTAKAKRTGQGFATSQNPSDRYCAWHKMYYAQAAKHHWKGPTGSAGTGTCERAKKGEPIP